MPHRFIRLIELIKIAHSLGTIPINQSQWVRAHYVTRRGFRKYVIWTRDSDPMQRDSMPDEKIWELTDAVFEIDRVARLQEHDESSGLIEVRMTPIPKPIVSKK